MKEAGVHGDRLLLLHAWQFPAVGVSSYAGDPLPVFGHDDVEKAGRRRFERRRQDRGPARTRCSSRAEVGPRTSGCRTCQRVTPSPPSCHRIAWPRRIPRDADGLGQFRRRPSQPLPGRDCPTFRTRPPRPNPELMSPQTRPSAEVQFPHHEEQLRMRPVALMTIVRLGRDLRLWDRQDRRRIMET